MEEQPNKGRDPKTGRFLKGNPAGNQKKKPGPIVPHPTCPGRTIQGHPLPGRTTNPYGESGRGMKIPASAPELVHGLKLQLLECATKADIEAVYARLFALTQSNEYGGKIQLEAIALYLDRFFGKPFAELNVNQKTTTTKVNVDLTALSDDELQQYIALQGKVQSNLVLEDKRADDIVIEDTKGESGPNN